MSLDAIIAKVRSVAAMAEQVAKESAPLVEAEAKRTAGAGTSPGGQAWADRKDGKPALVNAASAVKARSVGDVVQVALGSTETGSAKVQAIQNTTRQIIPAKGEALPTSYRKIVAEVASRVFARLTGVA